MNSLSKTIFLLLFSWLPVANASQLEVKLCDIGERQQFETISCNVELKNNGAKPIHISDAQPIAVADRVEPTHLIILPNSVGYLKTTVDVRDAVGFTHHKFSFATDEPGLDAQRTALVQGFINTVLDQPAPILDFENTNLDASSTAKRSVTLTSKDVENFRLLEITGKPEYVDARIEKDGTTVTATLKKTAPWGLLQDTIRLRTNAPQQKEAWIRLKGNVSGEIVVDSNPFPLGTMRTNGNNEFLIRLTSRSGKNFEVGHVELVRTKGTVDVVPCVPATTGCRLLKLVVSNDQARGVLGGQIIVDIPGFKRTLPIRLVGMLLNPETPIHNLNEEMEKEREVAGTAQSGASGGTSSSAVDVKQAIKQSADQQQEELAPPPGTGPLLRWTVANDQTVYGYVIYRAEAESGPSKRVNTNAIRVTPREGQSTTRYQWRDNTASAGKTYWYSIGVIKVDGQKDLLGGAQKVVAK